jgi:hypothetical protein
VVDEKLAPGPFLDQQQTGAVMQVHEGRNISGVDEQRFQIVEKDFFVRPGKLLFAVFQVLPVRLGRRLVRENPFLCRIAQKHLADDRFDPPKTALRPQINTFGAGMGFAENRQQEISLIRSGKQGVYHDIRKKRDDAFPGTAGAEAALKAFLRADGCKMGIQKGIHILPELQVFMGCGFQGFDLVRGKRVQMRCCQKDGFKLLLLIGADLHLMAALAIGAVSGTGQIHAEINQFAGFDPVKIF